MNERIKELWDKAATASAAYPSGQNNSWETQVNFMEKFAELIVQETMQVVAKRKDQAIDDGWNVDEAMSMAEMDLEEHFGVEE